MWIELYLHKIQKKRKNYWPLFIFDQISLTLYERKIISLILLIFWKHTMNMSWKRYLNPWEYLLISSPSWWDRLTNSLRNTISTTTNYAPWSPSTMRRRLAPRSSSRLLVLCWAVYFTLAFKPLMNNTSTATSSSAVLIKYVTRVHELYRKC